MSQQLGTLTRAAGLVAARRAGRHRIYATDDPPAWDLLGVLARRREAVGKRAVGWRGRRGG